MVVINFSALVTSCLLALAAGVQITDQSRAAALDPATCVEAIVVEPRELQSIATALESAVNSKNAHFDQFTIAHSNNNGEYVRKLVANSTILSRQLKTGKLIFRHLEVGDLGDSAHRKGQGLPDTQACPQCRSIVSTNLTKDDLTYHDEYSRLLKSREFWEGFTCDRSLLMQSDTVLCANSNVQLSAYMEYEFVGAHTPKLDKFKPGRRMHMNGGLSFRNRKGMLRCIDKAPSSWKGKQMLRSMPEDGFFSSCEQLKQPSKGELDLFSVDNAGRDIGPGEGSAPFAVHKPWVDVDKLPGYAQSNLDHCEGAKELMDHMKQ